MTKGKKVSTDHSFRYGIFVRVVNHVIGTAIMSDNKVTLIANRIDLAKERLEVLKGCKCEEYEELKVLIEKN